jgi:signal transduction histidine kinase
LPDVIGDSQQLQQVFLNIVNNAYDAIQDAGRRGKIVLRTQRIGDSIEVALIDNGTGISDPAKIFDPFFTTKPTGKGTGLGLSICYGIVRAHGGEIQCWNNESGEGSTFLVRLPVATEAAMEATV